MSALWKKIEFYKEESDFEVIVKRAWGLGQCPGGLSEAKLNHFLSF